MLNTYYFISPKPNSASVCPNKISHVNNRRDKHEPPTFIMLNYFYINKKIKLNICKREKLIKELRN